MCGRTEILVTSCSHHLVRPFADRYYKTQYISLEDFTFTYSLSTFLSIEIFCFMCGRTEILVTSCSHHLIRPFADRYYKTQCISLQDFTFTYSLSTFLSLEIFLLHMWEDRNSCYILQRYVSSSEIDPA